MESASYICIINGKLSFKKVLKKYQEAVKALLIQGLIDEVLTKEEFERYLLGEVFKCASLSE